MVLVSKPKRRASADKRRSGEHHKKNRDYFKPYWPYVPIVLIVTVGLVFSNIWGNANRNVLGYATDTSISGLLQSTNGERAVNGLGSLALNGQLNQAAQAKANDMAARDYWSHNTPEGTPPWVFITNAGYSYLTAGENLAYGFDTSSSTVTAWMNSPEHRANILNTSYLEVGFGIANSANYQGTGPQTIVVAMYGSQQAAPAPVAQQPAPTPAATEPVDNTPSAPSAPTEQTPTESTPVETPTESAPAVTEPATDNKDKKTVTVTAPTKTENISRLELLTHGQAPWSMFAVSVIATVAVALFFFRHGLFWHRMLFRGESFVMHHKMLDIALVATAVIGFILTRSTGIIQ